MWIKTMMLLLLTALAARGATIVASSASLADVQAAVNSASDGDTVMIPNGSVTWTGGISTTKQILIRAQNYTVTPAGMAGSGATSRSVTIQNNSGSPLFALTTGNSYHVGLAGIAFTDGTGNGAHVSVAGSGSKVALISDIYFTLRNRFWPAQGAIVWTAQGGVLWNLYGDATSATASTGGVGTDGVGMFVSSPRAWNTASTMGTLDTGGTVNVYIEDSTFKNMSQFPDIDDNGRLVMRYCLLDGTWGLTHGFTSTWGGRHWEYYNNTFSVTYNSSPYRNMAGRYFWCRAGTGIFTDNTVNTPANTSEWGNVSELNIGDNTSPGSYPQARQPGWGHDGTSNVLDPIYMWNESGGRAYTYGFQGSWGSIVLVDRELYVNSGAKPGYSKYTYPHPLRTDGEEPPPDEDPPTVTSRTIGTPGTTLTITFNEAVTFGAGGNGGLTLSASGGAVTPSYSTGSGTSSLVYNLSRTVNAGETVTATYTQPGNGIEDLAGNDLANFTGQSVQNNSTFESDPPTGLTWVQAPTAESGTKVSLQVSATDASALTYYVLMNESSNSWSQSSGTFLLTNLPVAESNFFRFVATDTHGNSATSAYAGTFTMTQTVFTASGTWTAPPGVTNVIAEAWGGGGAGGASGTTRRPGGGGAAYARSPRVVTPESNYSVWVGSGGTPGGAAAQSSWFDSTNTVRAAGGANASTTAAGAGGTVANSIGTNRFAGGAGGARGDTTQNTGGGGGGSATWSANGSAGGAGGSLGGTAGAGEGPGGAGGNANQPGVSGTAPGGGGGGQGGTASNTSGSGAAGRVILSYFEPPHEPPPVDEDGPELVVNTPASSPLFTVNGTYSALVDATDASGVSSVTATNARGRGPFNGSADGDAWTVPITLLRGRNEITLTARDNFNNATVTNFVLYYTGPGAMSGTNVTVTGETRIVR